MEGSRHEKAAVTIASYAIGFTTAFILYANINTPSQKSYIVPAMPQNNIAGVAATLPATAPTEVPPTVTKSLPVLTYQNGKLEVTVGDTVNLLSFNPDLSETKIDTTNLAQGYHYGDINYIVSDDQKFVFFCERQDPELSTCSGFVYDVKGDRIYQIIKDGTPVAITERSAEEAIWTLFGLKIGSHYSANPKAPWVLISADSPLDLQ